MPLDQIDRIEVIRGPGGATWGANAVNGVINIVTKSAADTAGRRGHRRRRDARRSARGRAIRRRRWALAYRVYSQWSGTANRVSMTDTPARTTAGSSQTHGVRLDWARGGRHDHGRRSCDARHACALVSCAIRAGAGHQAGARTNGQYTQEYNVLGRWTRRRDERLVAASCSRSINFRAQRGSGQIPVRLQADIDAQYHTAVGTRHDSSSGAGYRFLDERVDGGFALLDCARSSREHVVNVFVQDEIALRTARPRDPRRESRARRLLPDGACSPPRV